MVDSDRGEKKEFLEAEDNEDVIGVMEDSTIGHKNKIEEKQEDMFDAHKIQQNVLDQTDNRHNPHLFMDFGEDEVTTEGRQPIEASQPRKEAEGQPRNKRKRGKRDVKKFDSDEDNAEEKPEEKVEQAQESIF